MKTTAILLTISAIALTSIVSCWTSSSEKVSALGRYQGYSTAQYDGYERHSQYLNLSDGTRLAYDLYLPTKKGSPADEPLPTLFKSTPYLRTFTIFDSEGKFLLADLYELKWYEKLMLKIRYKTSDQGHLMDAVFNTDWLERMLHHGYAVVIVERPGTGASFGVMDPSFEVGAEQADEILDWIVIQDWSDGNIGMFGDSWQAMIQFAAASTGNPHLKAIFPISSSLDSYSAVNYRGGVYNETFNTLFSWSTGALEGMATPVDADENGSLLALARSQRSGATVSEKSAEILRKYPFHDSTTPEGENIWEGDYALYPFIERINQANVPIYMTNGWYDLFTGEMFLWYANLTVPRRMIVRPLDHSEVESNGDDLDIGAEVHRWFDYWLKSIDNGILDEPPIKYYTLGAPAGQAWQSTDTWPVPDLAQTRFNFNSAESGSSSGSKDGILSMEAPVSLDAHDAYQVDYSTTSGEHTRWGAVLSGSEYPDMRGNDERALTYTTAPLERTVEITGHLVVHLWLATDVPDLDVFVYLEEVDREGNSTYITEGNLRASHRALAPAPYETLGLHHHSYNESDLQPIVAGEPFEMVFDLMPTSYRFKQGNCIRIAVAFADAGNFDTPVLDPPPEVVVLRNANFMTLIDLPVQ